MNDLSQCIAKFVTSYTQNVKTIIPAISKFGILLETAVNEVCRLDFNSHREWTVVLCLYYDEIINFIQRNEIVFELYPDWKPIFTQFSKRELTHEAFSPFLMAVATSLNMKSWILQLTYKGDLYESESEDSDW